MAGGKLLGFACLIDRSKGSSTLKRKNNFSNRIDIPTYTKDNLPKNFIIN